MPLSQEAIEKIRNLAEATRGKLCDKCDLPVPSNNNALVFQFALEGGESWVTAALGIARHLEPVAGTNGIQICEGSPSRWATVYGVEDRRSEYAANSPHLLAQAVWQFMQNLDNPEIEKPFNA